MIKQHKNTQHYRMSCGCVSFTHFDKTWETSALLFNMIYAAHFQATLAREDLILHQVDPSSATSTY